MLGQDRVLPGNGDVESAVSAEPLSSRTKAAQVDEVRPQKRPSARRPDWPISLGDMTPRPDHILRNRVGDHPCGHLAARDQLERVVEGPRPVYELTLEVHDRLARTRQA